MFPQKDFPPYLVIFLVSLAPYLLPFFLSSTPADEAALDSDNRPGNYLLEKGNYWQANSQAASQAAIIGRGISVRLLEELPAGKEAVTAE